MTKIENLAKKIKWDIIIYFILIGGAFLYIFLYEAPEDELFAELGVILIGGYFIFGATILEFILNLTLLIMGRGKSITRWVFLFVVITYFLCAIISLVIREVFYG